MRVAETGDIVTVLVACKTPTPYPHLCRFRLYLTWRLSPKASCLVVPLTAKHPKNIRDVLCATLTNNGVLIFRRSLLSKLMRISFSVLDESLL